MDGSSSITRQEALSWRGPGVPIAGADSQGGHHRLAVGVFEDAGRIDGVLRDLRKAGLSPTDCTLLGTGQTLDRLDEDIAESVHRSHEVTETCLAEWLLPCYAKMLQEHLDLGRALLCIDVADDETAKIASTALLRYSRYPVHVHDMPPDFPAG